MPDPISEPAPAPPDDALSEILLDLRLSGAGYGRCELGSPWGLEFPEQREARFHFIAAGRCWLRSAAMDWTPLEEGDVVLVPRGGWHALAHAPGGATTPVERMPLHEIGEGVFRMDAGGAGGRTLLACCSIRFEAPALHPLLELMPEMLLVRGGSTGDAGLPLLLEAMGEEMRGQRIGAATVMIRLADAVIAKVIRAWVEERGGDAASWVPAVRDPGVGRALAAMHRRPGESWSVAALAAVARASRSRFAQRFTAAVGASPGRYLLRWRMHLASQWLRGGRMSVKQVARRLGYESEASFSRAYKRYTGIPPSSLLPGRTAMPSG